MRFDNLQDWLSWIESCHPSEIELGLERMGQVFQNLNCQFPSTKIVTIAGTNGKGSCVAALEHLLLKHGLKVGCYTSPHFLRYNERVRINGSEVEDQNLIEAFALIDHARGDIPLTYFEYGTLAALVIFTQLAPDVVILEVGLGGRLDASNIVDADIGVVTNIDLDHQDWLGSDLEVIGREKSGIYRAGSIAICADPNPPASVAETALQLGAEFYQRDKDFKVALNKGAFDVTLLDVQNNPVQLRGLPYPVLPFDSVVAAMQVALFLGLPNSPSFYHSVAELGLKGRFQHKRYADHDVYLDVAHNPAAAEHLAAKLKSMPADGATYAVAAIMADKDIPSIVQPLVDSVAYWYLGGLEHNPRALKPADLANIIREQGCNHLEVKDTIAAAFDQAIQSMVQGDRLIVFGSFFTVAEVLDIIDTPTNNNNSAETH